MIKSWNENYLYYVKCYALIKLKFSAILLLWN